MLTMTLEVHSPSRGGKHALESRLAARPTLRLHQWQVIKTDEEMCLVGITLETDQMCLSSTIAVIEPSGDLVDTSGRRYSLYGKCGGSAQVANLIARVFPGGFDASEAFADSAHVLLKPD